MNQWWFSNILTTIPSMWTAEILSLRTYYPPVVNTQETLSLKSDSINFYTNTDVAFSYGHHCLLVTRLYIYISSDGVSVLETCFQDAGSSLLLVHALMIKVTLNKSLIWRVLVKVLTEDVNQVGLHVDHLVYQKWRIIQRSTLLAL